MKSFKKAIKGIALSLAVILAVPAMPSYVQAEEATATQAITDADFLKAEGKNLVNANGEVVNLRGTNAGGWLTQEFWMTPTAYSTNITDEESIYEVMTERFGEDAMYEIVDVYQDAYWTEADFDNCAELGMNVIRLPFWWRNLVDENGVFYGYNESTVSGSDVSGNSVSGDDAVSDPYAVAFERMDWFIAEAAERGMYTIIDFHGVPGSQNGSDHSGVDGGDNKVDASEFWFAEEELKAWYHEVYYDMWEVIAERYADNPAVAGYDLMNEPYCTYRYNSPHGMDADALHEMLWDVYDKAYDKIRAIDPDHVIIMEATWDPVDLPNPAQYGWENVMYEYHNYNYGDYDNAAGQQITSMQSKLNAIGNADYNVPSYMGEFSYFNNPDAWDEGLELLVNAGMNWTTWTYKTTKDYGMWGHFHHPAEFNNRINLETATYDEIIAWYSRMGESEENTTLTDVTSKWYVVDTVANTLGPVYAEIEDGDYYLVGNNSMKILATNENSLVVAEADAGTFGTVDYLPFTLVNNDDGTVSFKAANGNYISVSTTDKSMSATATTAGDAEKFYVLQVSNTTVAFKSAATDTYVSVAKNAASTDEAAVYDVLVQAFAITGDESFQMYDKDLDLVGSVKLTTYSGWTRYESEDTEVARIVGGVVKTDVSDYSGSGAAGDMNGNAVTVETIADDWSNIKYVEYTVEAPEDGEYLVSLNYNGNDNKEILVKTNDGENQVVSLPSQAGGQWNTLYEKIIKVDLVAGENKIYISGTLNDTGWANYDCIDVINAPLGTNDVYTRYEAENYFTNADIKSQSFYSGGKGIENCNSDTAVEDVAFNWANIKYADFTIYAEEAGEYTVVWGYTGAGSSGMTALYKLNGGENQVITLDNPGGNWNVPSTHAFNVNLEEGFNSLMLSGTLINTGHYANIDYIDVKLASVADTPKEPEGPSGWSHYEAENATISGASKEAQDFYSMGLGVGGLNTPNIAVADVAADWSNIKYVTFDVEAPYAGDYRLKITYNGDDDKVALVKVNDGEQKEISIPRKGDGTWNVIHEEMITVTLAEGENTVAISGAVGNGWYNIDYVEICESPISITDAETNTERYEAEFYDTKSANNPAVEVQNNDSLVYSGPAHQGVGGMGSTTSYEEGQAILETGLNWTNFTVYAAEAGDYIVKLACNGAGNDMTGVYQVNDEASKTYTVLNAGGEWNTLCYPEFTVTLEEGLNQLLMAGTYSGSWLNFDYIDVTPVAKGEIVVGAEGDVEVQLANKEAVEDAVLTEEDKALIESGVDVEIILEVDKIDNPPAEDKAKIENSKGNKELACYLNISLFKQIGDEEAVPVSDIAGKIGIVIPIPADLIKDGRIFSIIYVHDGVAKALVDKDTDPETITIDANEFSTYALVYEEKATDDGKDETPDDGGNTETPDDGKDETPEDDKNEVKPDNGGTTGGTTNNNTNNSTNNTTTNTNTNTNTSGSGTITAPATSPKTGDGNVLMWAIIALAVGIVIIGATKKYYLKKEDEDFV